MTGCCEMTTFCDAAAVLQVVGDAAAPLAGGERSPGSLVASRSRTVLNAENQLRRHLFVM